MDFIDYRRQLHRCSDTAGIVEYLTDNAVALAALAGCDCVPDKIAISDFTDFGPDWGFDIWTNDQGEFANSVFVPLGVRIMWRVVSPSGNGTDTYVALIKSEWPMLQLLERLAGHG